jgi:hypothetical protein
MAKTQSAARAKPSPYPTHAGFLERQTAAVGRRFGS